MYCLCILYLFSLFFIIPYTEGSREVSRNQADYTIFNPWFSTAIGILKQVQPITSLIQ